MLFSTMQLFLEREKWINSSKNNHHINKYMITKTSHSVRKKSRGLNYKMAELLSALCLFLHSERPEETAVLWTVTSPSFVGLPPTPLHSVSSFPCRQKVLHHESEVKEIKNNILPGLSLISFFLQLEGYFLNAILSCPEKHILCEGDPSSQIDDCYSWVLNRGWFNLTFFKVTNY